MISGIPCTAFALLPPGTSDTSDVCITLHIL
jgi:hypothetical protein